MITNYALWGIFIIVRIQRKMLEKSARMMRQNYYSHIRTEQIQQKFKYHRMMLIEIEDPEALNCIIQSFSQLKFAIKQRRESSTKIQCLVSIYKVVSKYNILTYFISDHTNATSKSSEYQEGKEEYSICDGIQLLLREEEDECVLQLSSSILQNLVYQLTEIIKQESKQGRAKEQLKRIIHHFPFFRLNQNNINIVHYCLDILYLFIAEQDDSEILRFLICNSEVQLLDMLNGLNEKGWLLENKKLEQSYTIASLTILFHINRLNLFQSRPQEIKLLFANNKAMIFRNLHQSQDGDQFWKYCEYIGILSMVSKISYLKPLGISNAQFKDLLSFMQPIITISHKPYLSMLKTIMKHGYHTIHLNYLNILLPHLFQNNHPDITEQELTIKELILTMLNYHISCSSNRLPFEQMDFLLQMWSSNKLSELIDMLQSKKSGKFQMIFQIILVVLQNVIDKEELIMGQLSTLLKYEQFRAILISLQYQVVSIDV